MARRPTLVAAAAAALLLPAAPAAAQLVRLHVQSMALSADPARVRMGDVLRLIVRVRVREAVARLDNVTLPNLTGFDVLGDERRCAPQRGGGSECSEVLSLSPSASGPRTLGPVLLDAIDARNGKATRFASNVVRVSVGGPSALANTGAVARELWSEIGDALGFVGALALIAIAIIGLVLFSRRRRARRPVAAEPVQQVQAASVIDDDARWRTMLSNLRVRPSRARVEAVRTVLRERIGAREAETFGDLVARGAQMEEPSAMEALRLVERAAFVDDDHLPQAVDDAMPALESIAGLRHV
jgi:hypothetical protein